jgi:hypothetical protein
MDISAGVSCDDDVRMAGTATATRLAERSRHLKVVRPAGTDRREQALSQARAARRKLEGRQDGGRFAYLRRAHD